MITDSTDIFAIQDELQRGELSLLQIADRYDVSLKDVDNIFLEMINQEIIYDVYDSYNQQQCEFDV